MKMNFKNIKNIVIVHRSHSQKAKRKSLEIKKFFEEHNIKASLLSQKQIYTRFTKPIQLILAVGGDGTYLKAVHFGKNRNIPVLGINMGSLGFLTPHQEQNTFKILRKLFAGKMFVRESFFLRGETYRIKADTGDSQEGFLKNLSLMKPARLSGTEDSFQAVNDIVIERGPLSHLISLSIYINKQYICSVKSDGLIIAGPLGSTAYNLAAGGPILHPKVSSFVITPICSHSLTNRPVIIHDKSEIQIRVNEKKAFLTIDGLRKGTLTPRNILVVKKDKKSFLSLTEKKQWEFELLRDKLQFGQRN